MKIYYQKRHKGTGIAQDGESAKVGEGKTMLTVTLTSHPQKVAAGAESVTIAR